MIKPNVLGRVWRYIVDAREYAYARMKADLGRSLFAPIASAQATGSRYNISTGLVDSAEAEKLAITCAWIYSDISLIADRLANARWEVKRRHGEELIDIDNHPFERLWTHPCGLYSGALLAKYLGWWYLLRGNAYAFVSTEAPGRGEPREIWPLEATAMKPLPETLRRHKMTGWPIVDYEYRPSGASQTYRLPGENVVHWRIPNPWDYWVGLSPLTALTTGIDLDLGARRWQRDFFREDNAVPVAIVQTAPDLAPAEFDVLVDDIKRLISEGHRLLFARSGDLDVQTIQQTVEQMQILQTRELSREEIDRVYHVPTGIFAGGSSGDAQQAMEISLARNCIQPILDYFAAELTYTIAPYYGEDIVIAAPNVVPQDRALKVAEYSTYRLERSINENRAEQNLDPIGDFPVKVGEISLLDMPIRILDLVQSGIIGVRQEHLPASPSGGGTSQESEEGPSVPSLPTLSSPGQTVTNLTRAAWLGVETEIDRWQRVALKELREGRRPEERIFESDIIPDDLRAAIQAALVLADTEEQVKAAFEPPFFCKAARITAGGKRDPNAEGKDQRESRLGRIIRVSLNGQLARIMERLGDPPDINNLDAEFWTADDQELIRVLRPELEAMCLEAAEATTRLLPIGFEWGLVADEAARWAEEYAGQLISRIDETTRRAVARKVRQYIETPGMTIGELRQSLEPQFGAARAEMIAVTEVTNAYARGQDIVRAQAEAAGLHLEPVWMTNRDELVCPICAPNDGKRQSEGWTVDGVPAHVRCRCWVNLSWEAPERG